MVKLFRFVFWGLLTWVSLSGLNNIHYGIIAIFFIYLLVIWLNIFPKICKFNYKIILYFPWLIKEIIQSSIQIIKIIWSYKMQISPTFEWVESKQLADLGLVLYGNSITLTPGTVTLDIQDNLLLVHALEKKSIGQLNTMDKKISDIFI